MGVVNRGYTYLSWVKDCSLAQMSNQERYFGNAKATHNNSKELVSFDLRYSLQFLGKHLNIVKSGCFMMIKCYSFLCTDQKAVSVFIFFISEVYILK